MEINIYVLPYDSGRRGERMGAGPMHWIDKGLEDFLRARGHAVRKTIIEAQGSFLTEIQTSFDLYRQLAGRIQQDCAGGAVPLVLSGNCGGALGGVSGLMGLTSEAVGVTWLDAHGDFNTPDTSASGFLDGMGLATAAGLGWKNLAKTLPNFRPVSTAHIVHVGGRDFDPGEEQLFVDHRVARVQAGEVRQDGLAARLAPVLDKMQRSVRDVYLHFDVDVLDPAETPANHFPAPGGLYPNEVAETIHLLRERFNLRGMGVASFDPSCDSHGKTRKAVFDLVAAAFEER